MGEQKLSRKALKTKKLIKNALAQLLQDKELKSITVQEVAEKADISRTTFYNYYYDVYDIYEQLEAAMDDSNTVYQWRRKYVRKNMSGVVPTLTANQGEGGHNVCLIKTKYGIRKMTPHECFNAQGFPVDFKLPENMVDSRLYKQAGNSVCVGVINRIAEKMAEAMKING